MTVRPATPADAMDIAYIHVDTWQSAYRGLIPDEYLDNLSLATRGNNWLRVLTDPDNQSFVLVADNEHGEPVGFVEGGPQRNAQFPYKGELYAIYVLKDNAPSRRFYESMGGQLLDEQTFELGGVTLVEVGYGWPDIGVLTSDQ